MKTKPEKRKGESHLAYYLRLAEWEREYKIYMTKEAAVIDRLTARPKYQYNKVTTKQTELDRRSLHDLAANNDVLRKILRRMQ